jgi:hypothetical protein
LFARYEAAGSAWHGGGGGQARSWWPTRVSARARRRLVRFAVWLVSALVLWWLTDRYTRVASTTRLGMVSGLVAALVMLWVARPGRRAAWYRRAGYGLARFGLLAGALCLLLWPVVTGASAHR